MVLELWFPLERMLKERNSQLMMMKKRKMKNERNERKGKEEIRRCGAVDLFVA